MKKYLIILLMICFMSSMLFMGVSCKEEAAEEVATSEEEVVPAKEEESAAVEEEAAPTEEVTVNMWCSGTEEYVTLWETLASEFMEEHPNIKIELEHIPSSEYGQKILAAFIAQNEPDIIDGFHDYTLEVEQKYEAWLDLTPYVQDWEEYKLQNPQVLNSLTLRGKLYGLQCFDQPIGLFVRKSWVKNVGWDKPYPYIESWEDLIELAKLFTFNDPDQNGKDDTWGYEMFGSMSRYYAYVQYEYIINAAGEKVIEEGMPNFTSEKGIAAAQFMQDCVFKYKVAPPDTAAYTHTEFYRDAQAGVLGIGRLGSWNLVPFGEALNQDIEAIPFPPIKKGEMSLQNSIYHALAISKNTEHPEEVLQWLKWLLSKRAAELSWEIVNMIYYRKDLDYDEMTDTESEKFFLKRDFEQVYQVADVNWAAEQQAILCEHIQNLLIDSSADPTIELQAAYEKIAPIFEE